MPQPGRCHCQAKASKNMTCENYCNDNELTAQYNSYKQRKEWKKETELLRVGQYPSRWWNQCIPGKNDKKIVDKLVRGLQIFNKSFHNLFGSYKKIHEQE